MAEEKVFEPINSQDELDARIGRRLERERESVRKEYAGYENYKSKADAYDTKVEEYEAKIRTLNESLNEKDAKIKQYETDSVKNRIAAEFGIPQAMVSRLNGDTEDDIRKDAQSISGLFRSSTYPSRSVEESSADPKESALRSMINKISK